MEKKKNIIMQGDALEVLRTLPDSSVDCCVTSPPYYGLRDYGVDGQIGLEETPEAYVGRLTEVFMEVYRMLKKNGTLWINIGDSYNGSGKNSGNTCEMHWVQRTNAASQATKPTKVAYLKPKDMIGIPWTLAFALRSAGWYLRQDIIWEKPNPMPENVTDRCTKAHEYVFLLSKSKKYYFDSEAIMEPAAYDGRTDTRYKGGTKDMAGGAHERWPRVMQVHPNGAEVRNPSNLARPKVRGFLEKEGQPGLPPSHHGSSIPTYPARNKRDVWTVCTKPYAEAHFATYPPELIVPCIKAGCPEGGVVLDPFMGAGTTAVVARKLNRNFIGIELNPEYIKIADKRLHNELGIWR
jgi:DNA modification methylase